MDPAKVGTFAATFTPGSGGTNGTISLTYTPPSGDAYTDAQLAQLTWSENVTNDNGTACGSGSQPASSSTPITLIVDTTACPPTSTTTPGPPSGAPGSGAPSGAGPTPVVTPTKYTVTITFTDPNYTNDSSQRTATASGS
jgi:hypothetical protein